MPPDRAHGVRTYRCPDCGGAAAGLAWLRGHVPLDALQALRETAHRHGAGDGRPCPSCERRTTLVEVPVGADAVELDVCPRCWLVWFDRGEAESLNAPPRPPRHHRRRRRVASRGAFEGPEEAWQWLPAIFGMPWEIGAAPLAARPVVTWALAGLVLVASLAAFLDLERAVALLGFVPDQAWRYGGATALTSFFVHAGFFHLVGNLYFFVVFGDNVEAALGWLRFLLLIAVATVAGAVLHAVLDPRGDVPCVGASGGIFGVLAYYALRFRNARLGVMYWLVVPLFLRFSAVTAFAIWALFQLLLVFGQTQGQTSVSGLAHVGGAAAGAALYLAVGRR